MQTLQEKTETREPLIIEHQDQRIFAVLHRPLHVEFPPIVCTFHGFASSKLGTNRSFVYLAEALAEAGIATLRFDFRGAGDSEGNLTDLSFEDWISDGIAVLKYIESIKGIDSKRVALFGSSLGGALAVLAHKGLSSIKTMVLWAPVASGMLWIQDFLNQNPEMRKKDPSEILKSYRGIRLHDSFRHQFGMMNAAAALSTFRFPILHMHGEKDVTITLAHRDAYQKEAPPGSRFLTYPEGEHHLGFLTIFPDVIRETVNWITNRI